RPVKAQPADADVPPVDEVDGVVRADSDRGREVQARLGGQAAVAAEAGDAVAGDRPDDAVRRDPAQALVEGIGDVEAAVAAGGDALGATELGEGRRTAIAAVAGHAGAG